MACKTGREWGVRGGGQRRHLTESTFPCAEGVVEGAESTSIFEKEQMEAQMTEPPRYQLSSATPVRILPCPKVE